jgi:hypothetical protein
MIADGVVDDGPTDCSREAEDLEEVEEPIKSGPPTHFYHLPPAWKSNILFSHPKSRVNSFDEPLELFLKGREQGRQQWYHRLSS